MQVRQAEPGDNRVPVTVYFTASRGIGAIDASAMWKNASLGVSVT